MSRSTADRWPGIPPPSQVAIRPGGWLAGTDARWSCTATLRPVEQAQRVFLATVDALPWDYEILGMVWWSDYLSMPQILDNMKRYAVEMGADGIIGIRVSHGSVDDGQGLRRLLTTITGTAVRWRRAG